MLKKNAGLDNNEHVCMICIHPTGFSFQAQVVWLHLVLPWKDLPQMLLCYRSAMCKKKTMQKQQQKQWSTEADFVYNQLTVELVSITVKVRATC